MSLASAWGWLSSFFWAIGYCTEMSIYSIEMTGYCIEMTGYCLRMTGYCLMEISIPS